MSENRQKQTGKRRALKSAWGPGRSGNPGGRPKVAAEVQELARAHGPTAIERLAALMESENENVAIRAAETLLDRGYGRPPQAMVIREPEQRQIQFDVQIVKTHFDATGLRRQDGPSPPSTTLWPDTRQDLLPHNGL